MNTLFDLPAEDTIAARCVGPATDPVYRNLLALRQPGLLKRLVTRSWAEQAGVTAPRVISARAVQNHYKPFARARVIVELTLEPPGAKVGRVHQLLFVNLYAAAQRAQNKYLHAAMRAPLACYGPPVVQIEELFAVAWSLPNGPNLDIIHFCLDDRRFAEFLVECRLQPRGKQPTPALLRYVPRRRALFRYPADSSQGPACYLKIYEPGQDVPAARNLKLLAAAATQGALGFYLPQLIFHDPQRRTIVMTEVPGKPLTEGFTTVPTETYTAVGQALATLHPSTLKPSRQWTPQAEVTTLQRAMADVKLALPDLIMPLDAVLEALATLARQLPFETCAPIHANLFGDQVLVDDTRIGIVDWDDLACGDPLYDLGRLIAHLMFITRQARRPPSELAPRLVALFSAYAAASGRSPAQHRLCWHIAVALLLRAKISALRPLPHSWIDLLYWSVDEAAQILKEQSLWLPMPLRSVP